MKKEEAFADFCKKIKGAVSEKLPATLRVEEHTVKKNNSVELEGMMIVSDDQQLVPTFYFSVYYKEYQEGKTIDTLADEMIKTYYTHMRAEPCTDISLSFANCKDSVIFRLVSQERNRELLESIPNISFLDLSIIFYILLQKEAETIRSIRLSNAMMAAWGVSVKELLLLARENTERLFPKKISSMYSVMKEFFEEQVADARRDLCQDGGKKKEEPYVLTNQMGINGAAVILYPRVLEETGRMFGQDYYLLPSSIHEFLVIPADAAAMPEELKAMVSEVNTACLEKEEILSDKVYFYSLEDKVMRIV